MRWLVVVGVCLVYVLVGQRYADKWRSDRVLWPYAASVTPQNPVAVVNAEMVKRRR